MKAEIKGLMYGRISNKTTVEIEIEGNEAEHIEQFKGDYVDIALKRYKEKRSLDANRFCWKLCTEIANVIRTDKNSVYIDMLKKYGQSDIVSVRSDVDVTGYFKYFEEMGKGYVKDKEFTHYKVFKGSSEYDTYEMSVLLDGIVFEAKELGISLLTESEIDLLINEWGA